MVDHPSSGATPTSGSPPTRTPTVAKASEVPPPRAPAGPGKGLDPVAGILVGLADWNPPAAELEGIVELATRSLDTVTHLTEYEDDKANRILTAIAFVSAFAGVVFTLVPDRYPPTYVAGLLYEHDWGGWLALSLYILFAIYALALLIGVVLVLLAVKPRFNVPAGWKKGSPRSFLFYQKIIETEPTAWGEAFATRSLDALRLEYAKNCVLESYLIAQKIPRKLRPLTIGVRLFLASTIILLVLVILMAITFVTVPAQPHDADGSTRLTVLLDEANG